jgi:hypothetical protein
MKKIIVLSALVLSGILVSLTVKAIVWPNNVVHNRNIPLNTANNYETSGLVVNSLINKIYAVSDDGQVTRMNLDGSAQEFDRPRLQGIGTDFEAITIVDPNSTKVYIGLEHPDSILEYDWATKVFANRRWDLTAVLTGADNQGLEGLTFVPNKYLPAGRNTSTSGGVFFAAIQRAPVVGGAVNDDYLIYAFDVDINVSGRILNWWGIPVAPNTPTSDISDLSFHPDTGVLYVLYDAANRLIEMDTSGRVLNDYSNVPVADQEGIALVTNHAAQTADVYIASDTQKLIGWFSGFPVRFYDGDGDGVHQFADCDDTDRSISALQNFYLDADGDGLGSDNMISVCSNVAPEGYVVNSDDVNDNFGVQPNLIVDGDFEMGNMNSWLRYGTPSLIEKSWDQTVGSRVLHILAGSGGVQQTNIPVVAGRTYELRYDVKVVRGTLSVRLGNKNSNFDFQGAQQVERSSAAYVTRTRRFVAPVSTDFRLVMAVRNADVFMDNISIVEVLE